jgi:hypothetical protein
MEQQGRVVIVSLVVIIVGLLGWQEVLPSEAVSGLLATVVGYVFGRGEGELLARRAEGPAAE